MAYRFPYAADVALSVATSLTSTRSAQLLTMPDDVSPFDAPVHGLDPGDSLGNTDVGLSLDTAEFQMLAIDQHTPDGTDCFALAATLYDPFDRAIHLQGTGCQPQINPAPPGGGMLTNQWIPLGQQWIIASLGAWGAFDLTVDQDRDERVLGYVTLIHEPRYLRLTLFPWQVDSEGRLEHTPLDTRGSSHAGGFVFQWAETPYLQVPVVSVRAEHGDTLESIATDMAVQSDAVIQANREIAAPGQPLKGEILTIPLVPAAEQPQSHPSTSIALTWKEMMHGWTAMN